MPSANVSGRWFCSLPGCKLLSKHCRDDGTKVCLLEQLVKECLDNAFKDSSFPLKNKWQNPILSLSYIQGGNTENQIVANRAS